MEVISGNSGEDLTEVVLIVVGAEEVEVDLTNKIINNQYQSSNQQLKKSRKREFFQILSPYNILLLAPCQYLSTFCQDFVRN